MMKTSLPSPELAPIFAALHESSRSFASHFPGESAARQPVHTVYGGAHLFKAGTAARMGAIALRHLHEYAPDFAAFARALELPDCAELPHAVKECHDLEKRAIEAPETLRREQPAAWLAYTVYRRVIDKLRREPVEDFRIDFEDGFGYREDTEEDEEAMRTAVEVAEDFATGSLPPFIGIRIKSLTDELKERAIRTLDIFLTTLLERTAGQLPDNFVITLPKITLPAQVQAAAELAVLLEQKLGLEPGKLRFELMIETPQAIIGPQGEIALPKLLAAGEGRIVAAHFGVYDYTAGCNITAAHQSIDHPACDFARHVMQVALAGTGVWLSDGATNIMPVPLYRATDARAPLSAAQSEANRRAVHEIWRLNFRHIRRSLQHGFYQGWDLHPAQLPLRYAAVYTFFLTGFDSAAQRLRHFIARAAQATLVGEVFDDAATGQALLNYFVRALNCGAITEAEAQQTGLTSAELHSRSFLKILAGRQAKQSV